MNRDPFDATAGRKSLEALAAASEDIDRAELVLAQRMLAIVAAMNGWPAGRGFDTVGGRSSVSFCEEHGKERCDCGGGTTFASPPDPTGEGAIPPDRAKRDHDAVVRLSESIRKQADELVGILGRYGSRHATDTERLATVRNGERPVSAFECWSHARATDSSGNPVFVPASRRTTMPDGEARLLCDWCRSRLRDWGVLPTVKQVEQNHRGIQVRRPA